MCCWSSSCISFLRSASSNGLQWMRRSNCVSQRKSNLEFFSRVANLLRCCLVDRNCRRKKGTKELASIIFQTTIARENRGKFISEPIIDFPSKHVTEIIDSDANINNHRAFRARPGRLLCNFHARLHAPKLYSNPINLTRVRCSGKFVSKADFVFS